VRITIMLGGSLRRKVAGHDRGEMSLDLASGARVSDALAALGLGGDVVRVLMLNGLPIQEDRELVEGDRLALFPRELAYNMYVATNFFNPLARPEIEKNLKK
jgi:sulfur carrier protein ThiS